MFSRVAIFEFRMYFVPGAFLLFLTGVLLKVSVGFDLIDWLDFKGDVSRAMMLGLLSYFCGHVLQAISKGIFTGGEWTKWVDAEAEMKHKFWKGYWPSHRMLIRGTGLVDEVTRKRIIKGLIERKDLKEKDEQVFEHDTSEARELCHSLFLLHMNDFGEEEMTSAKVQESFFEMFQGFFYAAKMGIAVGFFMAANRLVVAEKLNQSVYSSLIFAAACWVCWYIFRVRSQMSAEAFVRKTFLSAITDESRDNVRKLAG